MSQPWFTIVFAQGDDFHEIPDGTDEEIVAHLSQWDFGDESEHTPSANEPWGARDRISEVTYGGIDYTLSINRSMGTAGLQRHALSGSNVVPG